MPIAEAGTSNERLLAVLATLRLFKKGRLSIPGILVFTQDWAIAGWTRWTYANPGWPPANEYQLETAEVENLKALWRKAEVAARDGVLANAIRRFSYANERERPDDALVDYMISAESLFLSDASSDREMRYRLSHRAAIFIDFSQYTRREVFAFMQRAYDARSAIVHGVGTPKPRNLKGPKGETLNLHDFTELIGAFMREALRKAVFSTNQQGQLAIDWDALIFPEGVDPIGKHRWAH